MIFDTKLGRYYHRTVMQEQAPIDALQFAREAKRLQGSLNVGTLPGLAEVLFDAGGSVVFSLAGFVDSRGKLGIEVEVRGVMALICQRCLGRLDFELKRHSRLLLAKTGERLPPVEADDGDVETVPAESVTGVLDLVEQEVLLGLPLAQLHADTACAAPAEQESRQFASPFGVLARLKTTSGPNS